MNNKGEEGRQLIECLVADITKDPKRIVCDPKGIVKRAQTKVASIESVIDTVNYLLLISEIDEDLDQSDPVVEHIFHELEGIRIRLKTLEAEQVVAD